MWLKSRKPRTGLAITLHWALLERGNLLQVGTQNIPVQGGTNSCQQGQEGAQGPELQGAQPAPSGDGRWP